ncbi:MAG: sigma 54-interacting transcriptional regulator [Deltaproteobacteria bacterium]
MADVASSGIVQLLAEGTAAATGDEFFRSLAKHAALALGARYAFVAESLSSVESRSLAYWEGSGYGEGFSYRFEGTPCKRVAEGYVCATQTRLQQLFPEDLWLQQIGVDSYVGVPLTTRDGRVLGHLAVLHTAPLQPSAEQLSALQIFASRACSELERVHAERALRAALAEVEQLRDRLQAENVYLWEEIKDSHPFEEIVGDCPAWQTLVAEVEAVAATNATVLIQGETGTGKELVARALHSRSPRRERPLVKVNCAAISAGLVESELFGHSKGAFTGAIEKRVGRFELANGGTIFLDEVGELPLDTQVKLLRVLQEGEFEPVGSSTTLRVDARVIAATNRDLEQAMRAGKFRPDLYYRLNVFPLWVPPLRERRADISALMIYFVDRYARRIGKDIRGVSTATMQAALAYDWPGNVRELENLVERAVVLSRGPALELDPKLLAPRLAALPPSPRSEFSAPRAAAAAAAVPAAASAEVCTLEELERRHIQAVLERALWVIEGSEGAARLLDMSPSTIRSRMKRLGITRPSD